MATNLDRLDHAVFVKRARLVTLIVVVAPAIAVGAGLVARLIIGSCLLVAAGENLANIGLAKEVVAVLGHLDEVFRVRHDGVCCRIFCQRWVVMG